MYGARLGLGTLWIIFTVAAATLLGTDFILNEVRIWLGRHRDSGTR